MQSATAVSQCVQAADRERAPRAPPAATPAAAPASANGVIKMYGGPMRGAAVLGALGDDVGGSLHAFHECRTSDASSPHDAMCSRQRPRGPRALPKQTLMP
jgi:hypothetical protein